MYNYNMQFNAWILEHVCSPGHLTASRGPLPRQETSPHTLEAVGPVGQAESPNIKNPRDANPPFLGPSRLHSALPQELPSAFL